MLQINNEYSSKLNSPMLHVPFPALNLMGTQQSENYLANYSNESGTLSSKKNKKKRANSQNGENDMSQTSSKFLHNGHDYLELNNSTFNNTVKSDSFKVKKKKQRNNSLKQDFKKIPLNSTELYSQSEESQLYHNEISTSFSEQSEPNAVSRKKKRRKRSHSFNDEIKDLSEIHSDVHNGGNTDVYNQPDVKKRKKKTKMNQNEENEDLFTPFVDSDTVNSELRIDDFLNKKNKKKAQRINNLNGEISDELCVISQDSEFNYMKKKKKKGENKELSEASLQRCQSDSNIDEVKLKNESFSNGTNEIDSCAVKKKKKKYKSQQNTYETQPEIFHTHESKLNNSLLQDIENNCPKKKKKKKHKYSSESESQRINNLNGEISDELCVISHDSEFNYMKKKKKEGKNKESSEGSLQRCCQSDSNIDEVELKNESLSNGTNEVDSCAVKKKKKKYKSKENIYETQPEVFHTDESKLNNSVLQDIENNCAKKKKKKKHKYSSESESQRINNLNGEISDELCVISQDSEFNYMKKKKKKGKNKELSEGSLQRCCQSDSNIDEVKLKNESFSNGTNEIDSCAVKKKKKKYKSKENTYETQPEVFHTDESKLNNSLLQDIENNCPKKKKKKHKYSSESESQTFHLTNNSIFESKLNGSILHNTNENDLFATKKKKKHFIDSDTYQTQPEIFHTQTDIPYESNLDDSFTQDSDCRKKKKKKKEQGMINEEKNKDASEGQTQSLLQIDSNMLKPKIDGLNSHSTSETDISFQISLNNSTVQNLEANSSKKKKKRKEKNRDSSENEARTVCRSDISLLNLKLNGSISHDQDEDNYFTVKKKKKDKHSLNDNNIYETQPEIFYTQGSISSESKLNSSISLDTEIDFSGKKKKKKKHETSATNASERHSVYQTDSNIFELHSSISQNTNDIDSFAVKKKNQEKHNTNEQNHNKLSQIHSEVFNVETDMSLESELHSLSSHATKISFSNKKNIIKEEACLSNEEDKDTSECQLQSVYQVDSNASSELKLNTLMLHSDNDAECFKEKKKKRKRSQNEKNNGPEVQSDILDSQIDVSLESELSLLIPPYNETELSRKKKHKPYKNEENNDESESQLQIVCQNYASLSDEWRLGSVSHENGSFDQKIKERQNGKKKGESDISQIHSEIEINKAVKNEILEIASDVDNSISQNVDISDESETNIEVEIKSKRHKRNIKLSPDSYKNKDDPIYMAMCKMFNEVDVSPDQGTTNILTKTNEEDIIDTINTNDDMLNNVKKQESISNESNSIDLEYHDIDIFDDDDGDDVKFDLSDDDKDSTCSDKDSKGDTEDENVNVDKTADINMLKNLQVIIDFEIPPLHEIADWSTALTKEQRQRIACRGITVKTGKFSKEEDEQIKKNWKRFIELHDFPDNPELFYSLNSRVINRVQKQHFIHFLARHLPERTPCSVFGRFKRLLALANMKKGRYTKEEDEYILSMMKKTKCRFGYITEIANHLGRPSDSVDNRISILKNQHRRKIRWKKDNLAIFLKNLMKIVNVDDVWKLKNRHITNVEFTKLSKKLDNVPIRILKCAWFGNIHHRLFMPEDSCDLRKVKFDLVQLLAKNGEKDWKTVNWSKYVKHFDGFLNIKLYQLIKTLIAHAVPTKSEDLGAALEVVSKIPLEKMRKHIVYKLKYENNTVSQIIRKQKKSK
ncbi:uncharacterized protein LOC143198912 [Rhynchophorus ferrugineus]|uniref:uncharacterized protein LOC143198912 n=1 Tax=Rhynchophorus ferrugineus TaxID=354439 RepID=UPI003FCD6511